MNNDHSEAELIRRRRTARHLALSVGAFVLFAAAIAALFYLTNRPVPTPEPTPSPSPSQTVAPEQPTLLLQVTTVDGAIGNLLTAIMPGREAAAATSAAVVRLPDDLVVSSRSAPPQRLRQTVATIDTLRAPQTVAETLGVRVDASWRMDRKALAGLVDAVGGVEVSPARKLVLRDSEGVVVLRVRPGKQLLSGTAASWYAVGDTAPVDPGERMERFATVVLTALSELPQDEPSIREALTALGALSPATISTQELSVYLLQLVRALADDRVTVRDLPTTTIGVGQAAQAWTDFRGAAPMMRRLLPDALWRAGTDGPPRVLVMTSRETPGLITSTRAPILAGGQVWVDGRGTQSGQVGASQISVRGKIAWGFSSAASLGLAAQSVSAVPTEDEPTGQPWADVDVRLGRNYTPQ